jgi:hypothetical protein
MPDKAGRRAFQPAPRAFAQAFDLAANMTATTVEPTAFERDLSILKFQRKIIFD